MPHLPLSERELLSLEMDLLTCSHRVAAPCILDSYTSRFLICGIELDWNNFIPCKRNIVTVDHFHILWLIQSLTWNTSCMSVAKGLSSRRRLSSVGGYRVNLIFIRGFRMTSDSSHNVLNVPLDTLLPYHELNFGGTWTWLAMWSV